MNNDILCIMTIIVTIHEYSCDIVYNIQIQIDSEAVQKLILGEPSEEYVNLLVLHTYIYVHSNLLLSKVTQKI